MKDQFIDDVVAYLGDRLIFAKKRRDKNFGNSRMFFNFAAKDKDVPMYQRSITREAFIYMCQTYNNKEDVVAKEFFDVGRQMGHTKCRCCNKILGNGGGWLVAQHNGRKDAYQVSGGASHYAEHGMGMNVVSFYFEQVGVHVQFIGGQEDVNHCHDLIATYTPKTKMKI